MRDHLYFFFVWLFLMLWPIAIYVRDRRLVRKGLMDPSVLENRYWKWIEKIAKGREWVVWVGSAVTGVIAGVFIIAIYIATA